MIEITDKSKCSGCTACMNVCPKSAIKMIADEEGFLYPKVDLNKCIDCGLCDKICPIKNKQKNEFKIKAYAVRSKDLEILKTSTSGGAFTPIAKKILSEKGFVYGVGFDKNKKIIHKCITNEEDLKELRGSKYIQSDLDSIFNDIKEKLKEDKKVLFSGTPCQVEGLKAFLRRDYSNLYTIDVVCHGTPSPKLWEEYINYQEKKYNSKIKNVYFRNKTYGYHSGSMKLVFENGREYYGSARIDFVLKSFFEEISSRPSCYKCAFKKPNHISDFTIFDCWHPDKLVNGLKDDDKGYTNMFINSKKAENLINALNEDLEIYEIDLQKAIKLDGRMINNSTIAHKNRNDFYKSIDNIGLKGTVDKYIKITKGDYILEKSKYILYKTGILKSVRNLKKKIKAKR